jgi:hypothetical protein
MGKFGGNEGSIPFTRSIDDQGITASAGGKQLK